MATVTFAQFPAHSSCGASAPAAPAAAQFVHFLSLPAAGEAFCFHAAVE